MTPARIGTPRAADGADGLRERIALNLRRFFADGGPSGQRLRQSDIAERMGVNASQVSEWATGAVCPDLLTAVKLADALGVPLDWLVGHPDGAPWMFHEKRYRAQLGTKPGSDPVARVWFTPALVRLTPGWRVVADPEWLEQTKSELSGHHAAVAGMGDKASKSHRLPYDDDAF